MDKKLRRRLQQAIEARNWELFFNLVYRAYHHKIFLIATSRPNQLDRVVRPEDVVQDVFLKLFTKYNIYSFTDSKLDSIPNLLITITVNQTFDINRRKRTKLFSFYPNEIPETRNEQIADDFESELHYSDFLKHLLTALSETQKQVFRLRLNGYAYREIAKHMDLTEDNTRQHFRQARLKLVKLISRETILA